MHLRGGMGPKTTAMYDVVYVDRSHHESVVASGLGRDAACEVARQEASKRKIGRMFLAGSEPTPRSDLIVIVASRERAAA